MLKNVLRFLSYLLAILALAAGVALLLGDAKPGILPSVPPSVVSAAPLLLVGIAFLAVQPVLRPGLGELIKNAILAGTFLLWGAIQFMPQNATSARLGNLVIVLYVLDLAWVILGTKISPQQN
jgi:hypothetical protein